ncbi:MFS general substrate transporter [Macrolepiota fuliginosa MF-IS2]|uniref:MFS general substrate transporter n=1 Tax=Macrolepiota fuliginosa MF-IS2 TaxID=1400762 RepID=A0A9P5X5F7_9AGAR|nr:MFS general substrate transporter [Macrolepiota fuliginosa MF-IS2]
MKSHGHANTDETHLQPTPPSRSNTRRSRRLTPDPAFLQAIDNMSSNPIRLSLMHLSNLSHSSLDSEVESPSIYSSDLHTIDVTEQPPSQHRIPASRETPGDRMHTRQPTLALSDPVFVKAIDEMAGNPVRLSLAKFEAPLDLKEDDITEKRRSDLTDAEKGKGVDLTVSTEGAIYVDFEANDKRNPAKFSKTTKWTITGIASFATFITACTAASYNLGFPSMTRDLNCTQFQATIGLSVYALGFGVVPLVTASFSEEFGRQPLYIGSGIGFTLMYLMIALSKNVQTVIIARFLQGSFGSTGATMVGGTIADIWAPSERGLPMAIFSVAALGGNGIGPAVAGWVSMNPRLGWRWIQWIQLMVAGLYLVLLPFLLKETRSTVLLTRMAKKLRKKTGDPRYRARVEDERMSLKSLIWISCTRPIYLLLTESIVLSFSLWIGFAWGVTYCMIQSIGAVFRTLHDFNTGQVGLVFLTMFIGCVIGFLTNFYQEHLYKKYYPTRGPEARLYCACVAAFFLPAAMFIYAWSSLRQVHWSVLTVGITMFIAAMFVVYLAVFSYLADCYGPFASSALAGQSLARNLSATAFPLFTTQMYNALDYKWANTLFGCLSVLMIPIPFVLFFYGPAIRQRSKFSRQVFAAQQAS